MKLALSHKTVNYYYLFMLAVYLIGLLIPDYVRMGVIASGIICVLIVEFFIRNSFKIGRGMDFLVLAYILYNLLSFLWFLLSGLPVSVYIQEFSNSILPVFFYFFASTKQIINKDFYNKTLLAIVLFFTIGFILFIWQPFFYRYFINLHDAVGGTNPVLTSGFYRSIIGLTATGSLGALGVIFSFSTMLDSKGRKGKIAFILCLVAVILTYRRSALFVAFAAILVLHYLAYFKFNVFKKKYLVLELLLIFGVVLVLINQHPDFLPDLFERLSMLFEAFSERSESWSEGLKHGNLIVGSGLGVFSHKAIPYTDTYIPDGNYVRMLAELGIVGTILFLSIVLSALAKGFKNLKEYYLETAIIIAICLQAFGSNIFAFQLIIPIFWYAIGRIHQKNVL